MPTFVLFGPPGAGKSTIGKALSKITGLECFDSDHEIEQRAGKKISEIFVENGEAAFRAIEVEVVSDLLRKESGILALGGGAVMNDKTAAQLSESKALKVFLDVGIGQASIRVGFNKDRPMLLVNPRQQWLSLMEKRRPRYEELADLTISTDSMKPAEVAAKIVEAHHA